MEEDGAMAKEKKPEESAGNAQIDFGLGGLFKGIGNIIEQVSKLSEVGEGGMRTGEFTIPGLGDKAKGIFGFSIKTLGQDKVKVEPFGNVRETKAGPVVEEVREPIVDVFDEGDQIRVLAEMPGVDETDIKHEVKGDILTISTEDDRKYEKEILLPASVKEEGAKVTYKNGILEIRLIKA